MTAPVRVKERLIDVSNDGILEENDSTRSDSVRNKEWRERQLGLDIDIPKVCIVPVSYTHLLARQSALITGILSRTLLGNLR